MTKQAIWGIYHTLAVNLQIWKMMNRSYISTASTCCFVSWISLFTNVSNKKWSRLYSIPPKVRSDLGTANRWEILHGKGLTCLAWTVIIKKTVRYRLGINVNIRTPISNIPAYYSPLWSLKCAWHLLSPCDLTLGIPSILARRNWFIGTGIRWSRSMKFREPLSRDRCTWLLGYTILDSQ